MKNPDRNGTMASVRTTYARLMEGFDASHGRPTEERWQWLAAAHVVGQSSFQLHWRNHLAMLDFARDIGDWREVAGQAVRLALVPLGHLLGRLPAGNIGRATVSAFQPMQVPVGVQRLIDLARQSPVGRPGRPV